MRCIGAVPRTCALLLALTVTLPNSRAVADFLIYEPAMWYGGVPLRFHEDGTPSNITYYAPSAPNLVDLQYAFGNSHVLTADRTVLYNLFDTLYLPLDARTGEPLVNVYTAAGFSFLNARPGIPLYPGDFFPPLAAQFLDSVGGVDLPGFGELFTMSGETTGNPGIIKRRNGMTGAVLGSIDSPTGGRIFDFNLDWQGALYVATMNGVYKAPRGYFGPSFNLFSPVVATYLEMGPDGFLYALTQETTPKINRYDLSSGALIDTVVNAIASTSRPEFALSPNGTLYLHTVVQVPNVGHRHKMTTIDVSSGLELSSAFFGNVNESFGLSGVIVLPVPEPATASVAAITAAVVATAVRRPRRCG